MYSIGNGRINMTRYRTFDFIPKRKLNYENVGGGGDHQNDDVMKL